MFRTLSISVSHFILTLSCGLGWSSTKPPVFVVLLYFIFSIFYLLKFTPVYTRKKKPVEWKSRLTVKEY